MTQISDRKNDRCVVRNCGQRVRMDSTLCDSCLGMLATGRVNNDSSAWFVTEILFLDSQNDAAMREVSHLHKTVNELSDD